MRAIRSRWLGGIVALRLRSRFASLIRRQRLSGTQQIADNQADGDLVANLGAGGQNLPSAAVERFDFLNGFFAFEAEQRVARFDLVAVAFEPAGENAVRPCSNPAEESYLQWPSSSVPWLRCFA